MPCSSERTSLEDILSWSKQYNELQACPLSSGACKKSNRFTHQNLEPIWLPHWPPWMWTISLQGEGGFKCQPRPKKTTGEAQAKQYGLSYRMVNYIKRGKVLMDGIWVSGAFDTHIARAYCGSARALPDKYVFLLRVLLFVG